MTDRFTDDSADHLFDGWDPRVEHYNDPDKNNYDTGAGARLPSQLQPTNLRKSGSDVTLFIRPLDPRYTEDSLRNIFSSYGVVTDVRILYPRDNDEKSPYGFVTYKHHTSAAEAIRAFNDSSKFEFKVTFSLGKKTDRTPRNRDQMDNSKKFNNYDRSQNYEPNTQTRTKEPDFNFKPSKNTNWKKKNKPQKHQNSRPYPRPSPEEPSDSGSVASENHTSYENDWGSTPKRLVESASTQNDNYRSLKNQTPPSHSLTPPEAPLESPSNANENLRSYINQNIQSYSTAAPEVPQEPSSPAQEPSSPAVKKNVSKEEMRNIAVKKDSEEKPVMVTRVKPLPCNFCQQLTFDVCSICEKRFCHVECSLNGWKNHGSPDCVQVAATINFSKLATTKNETASNDLNVNSAKNTNDSAPNDRSIGFSDNLDRNYVSDTNSPTTQYREFADFVQEYRKCGNESVKDVTPSTPKFSPVCDNNYDENMPKNLTLDVKQEPQTFSPPSSQQQHKKPFRKHNDGDWNDSSDRERGPGRRFRNSDGTDGSDTNRGFGGGYRDRNDNNDANRRFSGDKKFRDKGRSGDSDGDFNGGRSDFDNRTKFNDRLNRQHDNRDGAGGDFEAETKPSRGNYRNDGGSKPRDGYHAQNRINNISNNIDNDRSTSAEFSPEDHSSLVENKDNTRSQNSAQSEQKFLELNKIFEVKITFVDKDNTHYVRLAENDDIFLSMIESLRKTTPAPLEVAAIGTKCVARYNNGWYRGTVRSENPLSVFLIDVGSLLTDPDVRKVPDVRNVLSYRPFAVRVKITKVSGEDLRTWCRENAVITIKATSELQDKSYIADLIPFEPQIAAARMENVRISQQPSTSVPTPTPIPAVESKPTNVGSRWSSLQIGKPAKVLVTFIAHETEFFVAFEGSLAKMNAATSEVDVNSLSPLLDIREGVLAYAPYQGEYSRVEILSTDPLKVSFIDFGNIETCEANTLKVLPAAYADMPAVAMKIKLHCGTVASNNVKEYEALLITPLIKETPTIWIAVVGDKSAECDSLIKEIELTSMVPTKPKPTVPKVCMDLSITYAVSKSLVYGIPKSDISLMNTLNDRLSGPTSRFSQVRAPELDKIYACVFEDILCRGRLISLDPCQIYFLDYGNTELCKVKELFELPADFNDPPPLAKKMVLLKESKDILQFGQPVTALWDTEADTYLLMRDPTDPQSRDVQETNSSQGTAGNLVNVVSALGDSNYAVILEENRNVYKYINQEINENVDELSKPKKIAINERCLALYEDNWHRAKITKFSPLTVYFLDFANEMKCTFAQLKTIPPHLDKIPPLAFKIKTEQYVQLEEGSVVKITRIEEIEHNYWKVATVKEKIGEDVGHKRVQIISDPKHIASINKKKNKNTITASLSTETETIDKSFASKARNQCDYESEKKNNSVGNAYDVPKRIENDVVGKSPKKDSPRDRSFIKPFDDKCLLYTALSNKPMNYSTNVNTLTNGVEHLGLSDPIRNSTFDDINIPIYDHLLDSLRPGDDCVLIVYDTFSDDEYTGMLLCKRLQRLIDILDHIEKTAEPEENCYSAKRGDCVATFVNGINTWQRAYVVSEPSTVDPFYHVILFDVGTMHKTDQVYRLNDEFRRVPQLSVRINVTRFQALPENVSRLEVVPMTFNLIEGDTYQHDKSIYKLTFKKKTEDGFEAELKSQFFPENMSHTVQLTKWHPTREEVGVKHVPLMDGDVVKIGYTCQTNQCYVIPIDDPINEQRNDFLSKVALHCRKAELIEGELKLKEIVAVPYMKSYFRGQVMERKMDSYLVHILDLGAEIKVPKNQAKRLPDNLKFADCYAVCIQLHNVPCTDFNQMSEHFLKHVITYENEFTLHINESTRLIELKFKEEVEALDMKQGSNFNVRLSQLLMPIWKIEALDYGTQFFLMQLKFEEWPIGSELSLAFTESIDEKSGFMINRYGETYSKLFRVNLNERLREYAEEVNESYLPVKEELCVAKFDGQWFRAACIQGTPGKDLHLQFIDIGYQRRVPHTDIRRIHGDFLKHPAAALFCDVENYLECKCLPDLQGKVLSKCRVIRKLEDGGYAIHVANLKAYANV